MMSLREINLMVESYIGTTSDGYLRHFNYSIHESFYPIYCGLDIDVPAYRARGLSTRKAFIEILKEAKPRDQAKIIRGLFDMLPPPDNDGTEDSKKKNEIYKELIEVAVRLESDGQVNSPIILQTSETVYEALKDAEILLNSRGAKSAVDRAHTALHGYLIKLCQDRGVILPVDPSLTQIFKILRENFKEFSDVIPYDNEAKRVLGSMASALDSLNTIRNRATLAHPNELLLNTPEAMLYINLSRAVLTYIESKTRKSNGTA